MIEKSSVITMSYDAGPYEIYMQKNATLVKNLRN